MKIEDIQFIATLKERGQAIKFDSELEGELVLAVPSSYYAELIKMGFYAGKTFTVTITENTGG